MQPAPTRSFVIDTDTASDDAVALLQAVRHPSIDVAAITIVAGNVPVTYGARNAQITLDLAGRGDIPVFVGAQKPLLRDLESAQHVHGQDGMSGACLPEPSRGPRAQHAVLTLLELAAKEPGKHDLITLGPLTNIATALLIDPQLLTKFRHTYMMVGAADSRGNVSPAGEFNSWADPEAAAIVIGAAGRKTMIGWDVSRKYAVLRPDEEVRLCELGPLGLFASDINQAVLEFASLISGTKGYDLPDPVAMAVAIDESLITESEERFLLVSCDDGTRGQTYADYRHPLKTANTRVVTAVDERAFKDQLFTLLAENSSDQAAPLLTERSSR